MYGCRTKSSDWGDRANVLGKARAFHGKPRTAGSNPEFSCKMQLQYTRLVANNNQEGGKMNAFTLTRVAVEPNAPPVARQTQCETCHVVPGDQLQKQDADRLFEARLQWFLAVSRAA
jgi:hypothetical protein